MKAKKVYEFQQGQDPYKTMGIGIPQITHLPGKIDVENMLGNTVHSNNVLMGPHYSRDSESFDQMHILSSINYKQAKEKFGKHNGTYHGEVYYKIWYLEFMDVEFILYCDGPNAGSGSSIEIVTDVNFRVIRNDKNMYDTIVRFRNTLYDIFK
jgi:hypothetical protein